MREVAKKAVKCGRSGSLSVACGAAGKMGFYRLCVVRWADVVRVRVRVRCGNKGLQ